MALVMPPSESFHSLPGGGKVLVTREHAMHTSEIGKAQANTVIETATSPSPQPRASPVPVPNGKPTSPYVKESNPMGTGAAQTVSSKDPKAAAQAASDMRNVVRRKLTGYVGFANLPNQWHRKSVRKGFSFNVMVVGKTRPRSGYRPDTDNTR